MTQRGGARPGAGRKPNADADILALLETLRTVKVGKNNYTVLDRYRDFHSVFFGSEAGRRVLAQIGDLCDPQIISEDDFSNHSLLVASAAKRKAYLKILTWTVTAPPENSNMQSTQSKEPQQ